MRCHPRYYHQIETSHQPTNNPHKRQVLALWSTQDGALLAHRLLPKKALALLFVGALHEGEGGVVLVHDKVGDVRAYPAGKELHMYVWFWP